MAGIALATSLAMPVPVAVTNLVVLALVLVAWRVTNSLQLVWLLTFGLVAGLLELWADWLQVKRLHSLVYDNVAGLRLLTSPWYIPIDQWHTSVEFGELVLWLSQHYLRSRVVAVITLLGMALPLWYEELAARAPDTIRPAVLGSCTPPCA